MRPVTSLPTSSGDICCRRSISPYRSAVYLSTCAIWLYARAPCTVLVGPKIWVNHGCSSTMSFSASPVMARCTPVRKALFCCSFSLLPRTFWPI
ncbi:hypothetical protein D3C76_1544780 [compost metagenome]